MITVLGWVGMAAPVVIVLVRELAAVWRQRGRRGNIERIVERVGDGRTVHIVDIDRDGARMDITIRRP